MKQDENSKTMIENSDAVLSIAKNKKGETSGVRVQALDEDFVIALHDLKDENGEVMKDCDYDTLMKRLKELELDTFNRKQGLIIAIYAHEINQLLIQAGGEPFEADWYTSSELWAPIGSCADYTADYTWYFSGTSGCFDYIRYYGYFRCRPSLAFTQSEIKF